MNAALPPGAMSGLSHEAPDLASDGVDTSQLFARVPFNHLLGLQREQLISRLCCLKSACCRLAGTNKRRDGAAGRAEIADDPGLNLHGIFKRADAVLPAGIGIGDHLSLPR